MFLFLFQFVDLMPMAKKRAKSRRTKSLHTHVTDHIEDTTAARIVTRDTAVERFGEAGIQVGIDISAMIMRLQDPPEDCPEKPRRD